MNEKLFMRGIGCAGAGLMLSQIAQHNGREPRWVVPILFGLVAGWAILTALSFIIPKKPD